MATTALGCEHCPVRDRAACAALSGPERGELARIGRRRKVRRGETLFGVGDELACATLITGALKITSHDHDGTERILSLVHPAGFVGEMFAPVARHDVIALTDSEVCVFSRSDYEAAIDRFPALGHALLRRSAEDLFAARGLVDLLGRRSARQKVAGFLLSMARAASDSPCHAASRFELELTRGEIAALLGLTIETVSRQLTKLESDGVLRRSGARGIELVDPARLETLAEG